MRKGLGGGGGGGVGQDDDVDTEGSSRAPAFVVPSSFSSGSNREQINGGKLGKSEMRFPLQSEG